MDESTMGSFRHRAPILDGEFFIAWKNEMLEIFNEYHLNKYITIPCVSLVDPLHPTPDESLDMIRNLRTINLIIRGLPRNLIHYCRMLLTRHYDQRPFDETMCDALIANDGVKKTSKRCKTFAMKDASNTVHILVRCVMQGIRFSAINCL